MRHVPQGERARMDVTLLDFLPGARSRDWCSAPGAYRVRRGEGGAVPVSAGVDVNAPASIDLAELLRKAVGRALHECLADGVGEARDLSRVRPAIQTNDAVKTFRA